MGKQISYRRLTLTLIWMVITACMPTLEGGETLPVEFTPTATVSVCQPSPIQTSSNSFPEIRGTMHSEGEIWALLFFDEAHANEDLKIVWRVKGIGPGTEIHVQAQNEEGSPIEPIWGPEFHPESNWKRPGTEWGTGFNFPEPGCWTITMRLGATEGEIRLDVLDT